MKNILVLILFLNFLFAESDFIKKQKLLTDLKEVIQNEEAIAKAYEEYILEELKEPNSLTDLITVDYLGTSFQATFSLPNSNYFNSFELNSNTISYRLTETAKVDSSLRTLYESDIYRKKTFFYDDKIYIILEDLFAKNLYSLLSELSSNTLKECGVIPKEKYCIEDEHIKIYEDNEQDTDDLLLYYHVDKFQAGPIIITEDVSHHSDKEFLSLPLGVLIYDFKYQKYIKTKDDIKKVQ